MNPREFSTSPPGRLVRTTGDHYAFEPAPLPPEFKPSAKLVNILLRTERVLGRLHELAARLPKPERLIRLFLRREAEASSRIEQTYARVRTMLLFEHDGSVADALPSVIEVENNFRVLELAFGVVRDRPLTVTNVRALHAELFRGVAHPPQVVGDFRRLQNWIGRTGQLADAKYIPPPPTSVAGLIEQLVAYMKEADGLPALIRAAMVHYQFEAIHPFDDGNGRIGRAIVIAQFCRERVLEQPLLNPSAGLERNRRAYYDCLLDVSQRGDWNNWFELFCGAVESEAEASIRTLNALEQLREEYLAVLRTTGRSLRTLALLDHLIGDPVVTPRQVAEMFGITSAGGIKMLDRLTAAGIVAEVTGKTRNRIWVAERILDLFKLSHRPGEGA